VTYRQGDKKVYMEPLAKQWAVRFTPRSRNMIKKELERFGQVEEIRSQRLMVVKLARKSDEPKLKENAKKWIESGQIEFCQPVLRDMNTGLQQIPTDEISVRFKKVPSGRDLRNVEKRFGVKVQRQNEFVPSQFVMKASVTQDLKLLEVASKLDSEDDVEFAAPNFLAEIKR
jgi:hypothetical protein